MGPSACALVRMAAESDSKSNDTVRRDIVQRTRRTHDTAMSCGIAVLTHCVLPAGIVAAQPICFRAATCPSAKSKTYREYSMTVRCITGIIHIS